MIDEREHAAWAAKWLRKTLADRPYYRSREDSLVRSLAGELEALAAKPAACPGPEDPSCPWHSLKAGEVCDRCGDGRAGAAITDAQPVASFEEVWAATGYDYGHDALEQVRLGWELATRANAQPAVEEWETVGTRPDRRKTLGSRELVDDDERVTRQEDGSVLVERRVK